MKVCYKSFDGREFNTEEECLKYEENAGIKMYSPEGLTYDPNFAFAVKIDGTGATERFIEMCKKADVSSTGISNDPNGLYVWSTERGQYFPVPVEPLAREALKEYFKDTEAQE